MIRLPRLPAAAPTLGVLIPRALAFAALAAAGTAQAADPSSLYYERTLMARAGARCALFPPPVQAALAVSARQARGAAVRAGADPAGVDAAGARAVAKADAADCGSADLKRAAARVRAGYEGWARLPSMGFPGARSRWSAVRQDRPKEPRWTLSTPLTAAGAPAILGLTSDGGEGLAVAAAPALSQAYAVRLVLRDPAKAPQPYLAGDATAPAEASLRFLAASREPAPESLAPKGMLGAVIVRFPVEAAAAAAALDPREQMRIEWAFPTRTGERTLVSTVEVGDFAAARAFLAVGR
jgi:hypothetical protein